MFVWKKRLDDVDFLFLVDRGLVDFHREFKDLDIKPSNCFSLKAHYCVFQTCISNFPQINTNIYSIMIVNLQEPIFLSPKRVALAKKEN